MREERHECIEIHDADFVQVYVNGEVEFEVSRESDFPAGSDPAIKVELHEYTDDRAND